MLHLPSRDQLQHRHLTLGCISTMCTRLVPRIMAQPWTILTAHGRACPLSTYRDDRVCITASQPANIGLTAAVAVVPRMSVPADDGASPITRPLYMKKSAIQRI